MGNAASVPMYAIEDVPGKNKGLIATKVIPKGTRIISEEPDITSGSSVTDMNQLQIRVSQQVDALGNSQQQEFLSMHNIYPYNNPVERYCGIFRTNALPIGPGLKSGGVFFQACRINHACDHNASNFWNANLNRLTIHAVKDIYEGEEITICYLGSKKTREMRQQELWESFKFMCSCQLCSLPTDQSRDSDSKLDRIHDIDRIIEDGGVTGLVSHARRMLSYVDEQVGLWSQPTPDEIGLVRAYPDAFQIAIANGDLARARIFAERVVTLYKTTIGDDSPDVAQYKALVQDPARHEYYGMSMKWKTRLDEVPQDLGPDEFEDWLWKRRNQAAQGQLADLRDRESFPSFNDLPDKYNPEPEYFESGYTAIRRPVRHWCFLAEIEDFDSWIRLRLAVKDVAGANVLLFFHTDLKGSELARSRIQKGYTVALLYAVQHSFMFGEPGIRHENSQMLKIFPLSLEKLQNLCRDFWEFSTELDGIRICHACGETGSSLLKCSKCRTFWYCNRACQKVDWVEKTHKAECKVLRDPDWLAMLNLKWDEFEGHVHFPLRARQSS